MAVLAAAKTLVDVERLGTATALGMLWRERIGEWRSQKHHMWFFFFLCFHIFSYPSPSGCFHSLRSFSPLGFIAAGPCRAVVQGAEALPGLGAYLRAASALLQVGHRSCSLNPIRLHGYDAESPREYLCSYLWIWFFLFSVDTLPIKKWYILF